VLLGHGLEAIGIDPADAPANWTIVAVLEEVVKFLPVLLLSARLWRTLRVTFNPSDWLLLGFAAGTGFALVENTLLVQESSSAAADMRRHYGPHIGGFYLVPGAWGAVGYVGHGAATGLVGAGVGLSLWLKRSGVKVRFPFWVPAAAAFGWIVVEHALANLHVNTGSDATFILGNGRLTPWFYLAVVAAVIVIDARRARASLARSPVLRKRIGLLKSALMRTRPPAPKSRVTVARMLASQLRLLNAAAWFVTKGDRS
jgi:RsiW-degrading membrane proteinase PrsW (M82 family)